MWIVRKRNTPTVRWDAEEFKTLLSCAVGSPFSAAISIPTFGYRHVQITKPPASLARNRRNNNQTALTRIQINRCRSATVGEGAGGAETARRGKRRRRDGSPATSATAALVSVSDKKESTTTNEAKHILHFIFQVCELGFKKIICRSKLFEYYCFFH